MPVIMWGAGGGEIPRLKDIGFTHFIGLGADYGSLWANRCRRTACEAGGDREEPRHAR
jgi:hypothetical protein